MRRSVILTAMAVMSLSSMGCMGLMATPTPAAPTAADYAEALAAPIRPADDRARDAARHTAETLAFAGVRPGQKIADMIIGGGYFTRVFSAAVGPRGRVTAWQPAEFIAFQASYGDSLAAADALANVDAIRSPIAAPDFPAGLDLVFTAQNYHDMHLDFMGPADLSVVNRKVFAALKPGGVYIVIDHSAKAGSGLRDTGTLHRIDAALVRREIEAAGFIYEGESRILRNPRDAMTINVFEPSIRGRTDQFIYRFRKPRSAR